MTRIGVLAGKVLLNPGILKKKITQVRPSTFVAELDELVVQCGRKKPKPPVSKVIENYIRWGWVIGDKWTRKGKDKLLHFFEPDVYRIENTKPLTKKSTFGQFLKILKDYGKVEIEYEKEAALKARDNF